MGRADGELLFRVRTAKVLRVLNSPGRMAVVEALREESPRSAAEVAERVECGASAAHYHLKQLMGIGLVTDAGVRETGARPERLYGLVAREVVLDPDRLTPAFRREMIRGAHLFLRHAERDLTDAIETDCAAHREGGRLRITRDIVRLSDEDLVELRERLDALDDFLHSRDDPGNEHRVGLTCVLSPHPGVR